MTPKMHAKDCGMGWIVGVARLDSNFCIRLIRKMGVVLPAILSFIAVE